MNCGVHRWNLGFRRFYEWQTMRCPMRATPLEKTQITPMQTEAFLSKNRGASHKTEKQEVFEKS